MYNANVFWHLLLLLTSVLVVLLVLWIESTVLLLLLLQSAFGFSLLLGRGTGLTSTSDWLPSVTGGCQHKPEVNTDDKRKNPRMRHVQGLFLSPVP